MCSIIGIKGTDVKKRALEMIEVLKHRGPDAAGLYSDNKLYYNDRIHEDITESDFILAHNLLSIVGNNETQPIREDNLTIIANAEIYNYDDLKTRHEITDLQTESDCEIILKLIRKNYNDNLKEAVLKTISQLDGDYAFCLTDGEDYIALRDDVGVKPLYYAKDEKTFAFSSETKALKKINLENIHTLKPTEAIYNDKIITLRQEYRRTPSDDDYNRLKNELKKNILEATVKRVNNLDHVGLLFSAGVDSTLLAVLLKNLDVRTTLYTVGTENSQDLKFARQTAEDIGLPLKTWIINQDVIEEHFQETINAIEDTNLMKIGVGMTINLTTKLAHDDGQKVILSGQGADELFCGYNRYRKKYNQADKLLEELTYDLNNMYHVNLERDDKATMHNSVELRVPYLDRQVIQTATRTPVTYMLHSEDDKIRKHILRDVAYEMGVPENIAYRPKKAAQYGTGIDKIIKKTILKKEEFSKLI